MIREKLAHPKSTYQSRVGGFVEPAEFRLCVVTGLKGIAAACALRSNAYILLANVPHPGVIEVLTLNTESRRG